MGSERAQRPPAAPRLLLRLLPGELGTWVRLDLEEEFQVVVETRGRDAARRWYWRYALRSVWDTFAEKARSRKRSKQGVGMRGSDWLMDAMHGIRLLRREPVVSSAMIGTMVLAIGAVSAVASLVYGVAIRPLPFPESERIVQLSRYDGRVAPPWRAVGLPDLLDWRERSRSMEALAGWTTSGATVVKDGEASRILMAEVTDGFDRVLGISPAMGRFFEPGEFTPETGAVLVVSHDFWQRRLGGDPQAVGTTIVLDEVGHRIVGILPEMALEYPVAGFDAWRPLAVGPDHWSMQVRGASWLNAVGRLREGTGRISAQSELSGLQSQLVQEHPRSQDGQSAVLLEPLKDVVTTPARQALALLGAAVTAILMIACLNLAILLLARASRRGGEFSVRSAIGASTGRIRRQLLAESMVVGALGGLIGLLVAPFVLRAIVALYPGGLPRGEEVSVDWQILLGSAAIIVTTAIVAGLAPSFRGATGAVHTRLGKEDFRVGGRARGLLTGLQVAVCVPLLIASTLLLQTLRNMTVVETGFDGTGVSAFRVHPSSARYPDAGSLDQLYVSLADRLRLVPGIESASVANFAPFTSGDWGHGFSIVGEATEDGPSHPVNVRITGAGYYDALRIPLVRGRLLTADDNGAAEPVAMLNEVAAAAAFPESGAIGEYVEFDGQVRRVVGVVGSVLHHSISDSPAPEIHLSARQLPPQSAWVLVRSASDGSVSAAGIREAVRAVDPSLAVVNFASYQTRLKNATAPQRFRAWLVTGLGVLALAMALIGIYGSMSNLVSRTVHEIGIRMALGADGSAVVQRVLGRAGVLSGAGCAVGLTVALVVSKHLEQILFGVEVRHLWTYMAVLVAVWAVCMVAAAGPALRASRLDPVSVIRAD